MLAVLCANAAAPAAVDVPAARGEAVGGRSGGAAAIANCEEFTVQPAPLAPRAHIFPASYAPSRPHPVVRHRAHRPVKHRALKHRHIRKPVKHRRPIHRRVRARRPVAHRPAAAHRPVAYRPRPAGSRPALQRVTYAAPLCGERTQEINDLLGLDQPVIAAAAPIGPVQNVTFDVAPVTGTTGTVGYPVTGGPDIFPGVTGVPPIGPPGPPGPPTTPVPEPETWMTLVAGMAATGFMLRRRRARRRQTA